MLWQHIVLCNSTLLGMCLAYGVCPVLLSAACCHSINSVLWQHIVLCKSTLLGMCLAMVCVVCYVVRDWLNLFVPLYILVYAATYR